MSKTYGEMFKEALAVKTQEEAFEFMRRETEVVKKVNPIWSLEKCSQTVRDNLGYMAGYYDQKISEQVKKFFSADHPIFGDPSYWDRVTPDEAFKKGQEFADKIK